MEKKKEEYVKWKRLESIKHGIKDEKWLKKESQIYSYYNITIVL
jgi:hypothetical protein